MSPRKSNQIFEQSQEATVDFFFFLKKDPIMISVVSNILLLRWVSRSPRVAYN